MPKQVSVALMVRKSGQSARRPAEAATSKPSQRASKSAFDVFLDRGLHSLFDSIKDEPVPEELLRIIEQDRDA